MDNLVISIINNCILYAKQYRRLDGGCNFLEILVCNISNYRIGRFFSQGALMQENRQKIGQEDVYDAGNPVRNLWASVIAGALKNLRKKYQRSSAINFFRFPGSSLPWICQALGLDIDSVREKAEEIIEGGEPT
jgi:hypothetical protein